MPADRSATVVSETPREPKSCEWLFALLSTVKPAARKTPAYDVGIRNAKQVGGLGVGEAVGDDVEFADGDAVVVADDVAVGVGVTVGEGGGGGHFDDEAFVRTPSRLPKTIGAERTERIGAR